MATQIVNCIDNISQKIVSFIPECLILLVARLGIFMVFWPSAQTKIGGSVIAGQKWMFWDVTDSAVMLFEYEYEMPFPEIMAYLGTFSEFFFAIFILLGLFSRLSALGLLGVTLVIQYVYPEIWKEHLLWSGLLLVIAYKGAGKLSLDNLLK